MRIVPLEALPNQELSINVDGNRWTLRIKVASSAMVADVYLGNTPMVLGCKIAAGTPMLPYSYLGTLGNFIFVVDDDESPDWKQFGIRQTLLYVSPGGLDTSVPRDFSNLRESRPFPPLIRSYYDGEFLYDGSLFYNGFEPIAEA